jgi:hypothetical protein
VIPGNFAPAQTGTAPAFVSLRMPPTSPLLLRAPREAALWLVEDVLSSDECARLIARARGVGWHNDTTELRLPLPRATSTAPCRLEGEDRRPPFAELDDPRLALLLFHRLRAHLPTEHAGAQLAGLRPGMRCVRYQSGEGTDLHEDAARLDTSGAISRLTLLLYLNDNFEGGCTEFPELSTTIEPKQGRAVVFEHHALHRGMRVGAGEKYVLRSEVFYDESWAPDRPGG